MSTDDERRTLARLEITADDLPIVRVGAMEAATGAGLEPGRAAMFGLAVHEVAANSVEHAGGTGEFTMIQDDNTLLYAEIADHGPGMTVPRHAEPPPPDAPRGRGLWISQECTDRMRIASGPDGTVVRLEMDLNQQERRT